MKVDVSDVNLTDDQFAQIEQANPEWKIELSGNGELERLGIAFTV